MIIEIYGSDRVQVHGSKVRQGPQVPKPSRWHRMTSARLLWPGCCGQEAQMTLIYLDFEGLFAIFQTHRNGRQHRKHMETLDLSWSCT